ncbi:MAG: membrane protein insertase YidC [Acidobacteria bacterium]|nr:membrane protein insertase YidC [Acidobacteriota bacterium]
MERRVLLALALSILVLLVYQSIFVPPQPAPDVAAPPGTAAPAEPAPSAAATETNVAPPPAAPLPASSGSGGDVPAVAPPDVVTPVVADTAAREIAVEGEFVEAEFGNRGAVLASWRMLRQVDPETGAPIDLVPGSLPESAEAPFTLLFDDPALTARARNALFRPSADGLVLTGGPVTLAFDYEDSGGLRIRKEFRFDPSENGYVVRFGVDATLAGERLVPAIAWGPALGGIESSSSGIAYLSGPRGLVVGRVLEGGALTEEDVWRQDAGDIAERPIYDGQFRFAGVDNHYFLAAALTANGEAAVEYRNVPLPALVPDGPSRELIAFTLRVPEEALNDLPFFLGPKAFDVLEAASPAMVQAVDFGWLGWLVVPLHRSLTWIQSYVGNWGWSIIVLTVLVNIIIVPLRHKSVVSMRKMQELQPEMKAIQDRYKHLKATDPDKAKMNQEIMQLYRDRGANPVSGCLPMLLTFPVLFAFFSLLRAAVEIRGEPFIGWITDLTQYDPYYITPIVMGASMVWQQKLTPTQAEPMQQKIMMLMPVIFTFMFLRMPSGLVIYWLTSNVFGIGQTLVTNRIIGPPPVHKVRPPAERRVKQVGSSETGAGTPAKEAPAPSPETPSTAAARRGSRRSRRRQKRG